MKKVAVIQSNYIPWKGYFDIIHDVDLFIFYDDVKYTKNDWRNRNNIKTGQGVTWLTIPVGPPRNRLIHEVKLKHPLWRQKHWSTIEHSYSKAPYFHQYRDMIEPFFKKKGPVYLSALNQGIVKTICAEFLGIETEFRDSRDYCAVGEKSARLLDLLKKADADIYLSGPTAKNYLDARDFVDEGIDLVYKDYSGYPEYEQLFPPFEHKVSILDLLFNCGPNAPYYIWGWRESDQERTKPR